MIGAAGAERLAGALEHNSALTSLDLGGNGIGDVGAERLAGALDHNNALTSLGLGCNRIGAAGAERLAGALEHNCALTSLDIGIIGDELGNVLHRLEVLLRRNKCGVRILTVWCSAQEGDQCTLACTGADGSQVAVITLPSQGTMATLERAISGQLEHQGELRFVTPDGRLLDSPGMRIVEVLSPCKTRRIT